MWHMLDTKSKFSTAFHPQIDCQTEVVHESALSFASSFVSHHKLHKQVMDKTAQNNTHYKLRIDIRKLFKTFNIGDDLHICSTDLF